MLGLQKIYQHQNPYTGVFTIEKPIISKELFLTEIRSMWDSSKPRDHGIHTVSIESIKF